MIERIFRIGEINVKNNKIFVIFILMFLTLTISCTKGIKNEGNKIIVEKQAGEKYNYEYCSEIKESKQVK